MRPQTQTLITEFSESESRLIGDAFPIGSAAGTCLQKALGKHGDQWTCTREAGHSGPHVGHVPGGRAAALWLVAA